MSQKRGIHFIIASVVIWSMVVIVHATQLPIETKNLLTFCCTCPLMPLAKLFSLPLRIPFTDKDNPLSQLGLVISCAQLPYLLIAMWIFADVPDKLVMVLAMIFGAHLLPFGWLYKSTVYYIMTGVLTMGALIISLLFSLMFLVMCMAITEMAFVSLLYFENKSLKSE